jgi:hypothetical protein
MRLLTEIIIAAALIALAWDKPFKQWLRPASAVQTKIDAPSQPQARIGTSQAAPAATRSGDWMWDPAHRSTLDRPAYDSQKASQRYLDEAGRRYWIDGQGVRHYEQ